jgi:hypothetical protein
MTERKHRVEDLLESMGRMVVPVPDESEAERERMIDALNQRLDAAVPKRRGSGSVGQRWVFVAAAAALCVAASVAFAHFRHAEPGAEVASAQPPRENLFKRGDALHTDARETRTGTLENGAEVRLAGDTELTVSALVPGTDELVLDRGRVDLIVPKLASGHTLSVTTPDSTVTVRGTRFSVEVALEGAHAITSVEVTQGSVWVREGDTRLVLEAGSHWSSRAPDRAAPLADPVEHAASPAASVTPGVAQGPASSVSTPHAEVTAPKAAAAVGASQGRPEAPAAPALESSTLGQENDLYAAASRAARDGNDALAISDLNGLLSRFPSSPLAQNARVDRFRALNRSGRGQEAVAQARRYLADYPNGFARDEAKALVLQSLATP